MDDGTYVIFQMVSIVSLLSAIYTIIFIGIYRSEMNIKQFKFYFNIFKVLAILALASAIVPIFIVIL